MNEKNLKSCNKKGNSENPDIALEKLGYNTEFKNLSKQKKVPYYFIGDIELFTEDFNHKKGKKTIKVAEQKLFAYLFQVCFSFDTVQNK